MAKKSNIIKITGIFFVAICLLVAVAPIYWMFNTSFKSQSEIYQKIPTFFPKDFSLDSYEFLFTKTSFLRSLLNSFIVAFSTSFFSIAVAFPVAYAVSRIDFIGRKFLSKGILITYLIPTAVLYIPLFMTVSNFNLTDTLAGLILIYPSFAVPYVSWMLIPHIKAVPHDIEDAARIDGCSRLKTMYVIIFPLMLPGIVSTFIFAFSMCWGEYLYALVNINSTKMKTFPLIISGLIYGDIYPWGQIMAGGIVACIPILIVYMLASKMLVGGSVSGGVKQ
ncbi:MAG: carbohydrate ABC transporter permease [Spirochaetales bacterium]